jgi:uncharacterized protein (DUF1800 family)
MAASDILDERDAAHLLRRASFGGTPRDRDRLVGESRGAAVDRLLNVKPRAVRGPASSKSDHKRVVRLQSWWLRRMMSSRYGLQEKMVLFWHNHFPSSVSVVNRLDAVAEQLAMFRMYGLGSFRDLVYQVTRDRAMLDFLDGRRSQIGEVNENFARELMELFTLGPVDEDGVPNYAQDDVVELARALTGFTWDWKDKKQTVYLSASRFDDGQKQIFSGRPNAMAGMLGVEHEDGTLFAPGVNVLEALFSHRDSQGRPTLARFLVRKLWAWFATPEADDTLVDELSDVFVASDYDIGALLQALLTHDAFYSEEARSSTTKMPVEFVVQASLALGAKPKLKEMWRSLRDMGMELLDPPGVEGWQHGAAWVATSRYLARLQLAQSLASGRKGKDLFRFKPKLPKDASVSGLVDDALGRLGLEVSEATRQQLIAHLGEGELGSEEWYEMKYRGLFALLLSLPEFQVH